MFLFPMRPEAYSKNNYIAAKVCKEELPNKSNVSSQVVIGGSTVYVVHDIPTRVMYNLQGCYKSKNWINLENIGGGNEVLYKRDQSGYQMLGDPVSSGWTQNAYFKNKPSYQLFNTFEVFLKKSLNFIEIDKKPLDGESFLYHKLGLALTNVPAHQDIHLDC